MAKAVKLADIAQRLNVSTVTVSKALSNQKGVSEEMRGKIKALADELGYVSPSAARLMPDERSYNIGIIVAQRYLDQSQSFYWSMYQEVNNATLAKKSFTMLEVINEDDEDACNIPKLIESGRVNGIIVIGIMRRPYLEMLTGATNIPIVFLDFYESGIDCDSVVSDSYFGMYHMTSYLCSAGHKKIAYVGTLFSTNSITDRYFGYCKALMENGIELRKDYVINDRFTDSGAMRGYTIQLPKDMPTAFACNCDVAALELIDILKKEGYRVPEDISVVGFDDYAFFNSENIELSTYAVNVKGMARLAVKNLLKKMGGDMTPKGTSVVEGKMILGKTVKKPAK